MFTSIRAGAGIILTIWHNLLLKWGNFHPCLVLSALKSMSYCHKYSNFSESNTLIFLISSSPSISWCLFDHVGLTTCGDIEGGAAEAGIASPRCGGAGERPLLPPYPCSSVPPSSLPAPSLHDGTNQHPSAVLPGGRGRRQPAAGGGV